jgi:hypothetical protein
VFESALENHSPLRLSEHAKCCEFRLGRTLSSLRQAQPIECRRLLRCHAQRTQPNSALNEALPAGLPFAQGSILIKKVIAFSFALLCILTAAPAFATVTVGSPGNGADVSSPFTLSADSSTCSSQPVVSMGYSFDNSTDTTTVNGTSLNAPVSSATGAHTLHVKAWGNQGAGCVTDVAINVTAANESSSIVPSSAISVNSIESLSNWVAAYDSNSGIGSASGSTSIVSSPSQNGHSREFLTRFANSGGERYSVTFGDDETATNFFYDGWIYLTGSSSQIANLEFDMNQTMSNGQTAIYGVQCDGYSNTWDYTKNAGSPTRPSDQWVHSSASCNPRAWATNTWHHVQFYYSRDDSGNITYHSVWLDGQQSSINATVNSAFALGWAPVLLTNFQVDGIGSSGTPTVYLDSLNIKRW